MKAINNERELWEKYFKIQDVLELLTFYVNLKDSSEIKLLFDSKVALHKTIRNSLGQE